MEGGDAEIFLSSTIMIGCDGPPKPFSVEYSVILYVESAVVGIGLGSLMEAADDGQA